MKIAIADETSLKFCKDIKENWEKIGHEVRYENGASESLFEWADLYYVEWWSNNIHYLFNWHKEHSIDRKPKIIVRAIDIDVWQRGIRSQEMVNWVDTFICIAPHIERRLRAEKDDITGKPIEWGQKLHLVRPGVNLDKFTPKVKKTDGYQIGMVLGDLWWAKNHMGGLDIFATLARSDDRWRLHIRGQHEPGQYWPVMYEHYLDSRKIRDKVTLYPPQENMNNFYENIDVLLHPGMKESFCYAVAEAMAKNIPVVCNNFYGAEEIWPKEILYNTHEEAVIMIPRPDSRIISLSGEKFEFEGRKYIEEHYSNKKMFEEMDKLL